jgi:hypothetical protein
VSNLLPMQFLREEEKGGSYLLCRPLFVGASDRP